MIFEVALLAYFGVSIDVLPGFSYSYSALAVLSETVLVLDGCSNFGDAEYEYEKKHEQSIVGRGRSRTGC
jgi:hypothetical protein